MKKIMKFIFLVLIIQLTALSAYAATPTPDDYCSPEVTLLNQDPYPAMPGEYVKVVFQVTGIDTAACNGTSFQLIEEYPFYLDDDNGTRTLDYDSFSGYYQNTSWMIPFKIRVSEDAVEGDNELTIRFGTYSLGENHYFTEKFIIDVENTQTNFEGVIQSTDNNEVAIAIANTGKNTANSMIVKIPEQESYSVSGVDGQMVGNLEAGDYSTVAFTIVSKNNFQSGTMSVQNKENTQTPRNITQAPKTEKTALDVLISYTDTIGERRNVTISLSMAQLSSNNTTMIGVPGRDSKNNTPSWLIAVIVIVVLGSIAWVINKNKDKIINLIKNQKKKQKEIPDWMKKERQSK